MAGKGLQPDRGDLGSHEEGSQRVWGRNGQDAAKPRGQGEETPFLQ